LGSCCSPFRCRFRTKVVLLKNYQFELALAACVMFFVMLRCSVFSAFE
jgi:hypothetical protein